MPALLQSCRTEPVNESLHPRAHATASRRAPFAIRNLSVLAYAQSFTLWHYRAGAASVADTMRHGFFDDAADMFAAGDRIMVSGADGAIDLCVAGHTTGRHAADNAVAVTPLQRTHPVADAPRHSPAHVAERGTGTP